MKGILTNYGYILPDADIPQRCAMWFTDGLLEQDQDDADPLSSSKWKKLFQQGDSCKVKMTQKAKLLAFWLILGAKVSSEPNEDGSMEFSFQKPIVGHVDVSFIFFHCNNSHFS